ncbi:RTX toxin protein [Actinobacillus seminis]|uniref:RTX toxin protein n=1 Tax=Actinobacillus seminis TaxID=722 RepID=A0A380VDC5_9PAST|nr:calcium-binding protein [Actinobacillus seminis]SUU35588.1 RTX toxin protein [Actinobacillus seminis]
MGYLHFCSIAFLLIYYSPLSKESALYIANSSIDDLQNSILEEFKKAKGLDKAIIGLNVAKVISTKKLLEYGEESYKIVISFKSKAPNVISHQIINSISKLTLGAYGSYIGMSLGNLLTIHPSGRIPSKLISPIASILLGYAGSEIGDILADKAWELDSERKLRKYNSDNLKITYVEDISLVDVSTYSLGGFYKKSISNKFVPAPFAGGISIDQARFIVNNLRESYTKDIDKYSKTQNRFSLALSSNVTKEKEKNNQFDYFSVTNRLSLGFNKQALNESTETADLAATAITTDDTMVANHNLVLNKSMDMKAYESSNKALPNASHIRIPSVQGSSRKVPNDPLVLDLNGDGVRAVSYNEKPVLFDIDNDGGSLEETGWLSHQDGLLVRDLNNNGKIDNISEVFSEYYAGRAGRNGEAGEKPFANGFEALKSLDSNKDNVFDSKDRDFNAVRVWQDANHNGVTDAGELKTLSSLKITAIDLAYQNAGGQLFFGNELLAKGYFTRNGKKHEAAAVNFLANPRGHTITKVSGGKKTVTEAAGVLAKTSSFTADGNQARTLESKKLGVMNIQAGNGNDTLRGDEQDNWLAGGGGSDTFFGGDGNDVLLIDGDDLPQNIHGGNGDDIVQVVGNKGVSLDLGAAEVEIAHGGRGNDVFVSSGNSSVFVRGGDGNDVIVGSIANDALSGENGDDFISGNAGKDLIRGHRGNDRLFGDEGDDVLFGGSDDDMLYGGDGADTLLGEGGDDYLDGGEGEDIAEFSGNFADYKITKMGDGLLISDTKQGRDGTDFLRNIEKLNFKDITNKA